MVQPDAFGPHVPVFRLLGATAEQRAWLDALPAVVADLERGWDVRTGPPFLSGTSSWVAPAWRPSAPPLVLKVAWPHREARGEGVGLRLWAGGGAPLLYEADHDRYALLMEQCRPGVPICTLEPVETALEVGGRLIAELWRQPEADVPLESMGDVCAEWAEQVWVRYDRWKPLCDPSVVALGADLLTSLPATARRSVVVHGDANPGNLLAAQRRPWLAIDPKPMIGDPAYDPAPLLLQLADPLATPRPAATLRRRAESLAGVTAEPADRLLAWALARTVESALWSVERGDGGRAAHDMGAADIVARALGA